MGRGGGVIDIAEEIAGGGRGRGGMIAAFSLQAMEVGWVSNHST